MDVTTAADASCGCGCCIDVVVFVVDVDAVEFVVANRWDVGIPAQREVPPAAPPPVAKEFRTARSFGLVYQNLSVVQKRILRNYKAENNPFGYNMALMRFSAGFEN